MDQYTQAIHYFDNKNFQDAKSCLFELIKKNEFDADVWNFLGIIELNLGNPLEAQEFIQKSLFINPNNPGGYYNLGLCYHKLNNLTAALRCYETAEKLDPNNPDILLNIGTIHSKQGNDGKAEHYFKSVLNIDPSNAEAMNNLGNLLLNKSNFEEAISFLSQAVQANQENPDLFYNLATSYLKNSDYSKAELYFKKTLELKNDHLECLNNLGSLHIKKNQYNEAERMYNKILSYQPDSYSAYFNLGLCFEKTHNINRALESYNKAFELNPKCETAMINAGSFCNRSGMSEKSEWYFSKIMPDKNSRAVIFTNLGIAKLEEGLFDEAMHLFNMSLEIAGDIPETHYNIAYLMLLLENFESGWQEYEWRRKRKDYEEKKWSKPILDFMDISGKKILVTNEQGLGDSIQFIRYLKLLKERGAYVLYESDSRLFSLFKRMDFIDELLVYNNFLETEIDYDYFIPLMSLPYYFQTYKNNIPDIGSYIIPSLMYLKKWEDIIQQEQNFNIGIVWAGNPKHMGDKKRSCPLKEFIPLFSMNKLKIFSLQKNFGTEQLKDFSLNVIDLDPFINNFEDTAAAIFYLDLIITVDTSVAHLAGAMGKKVWLLLPSIPDWRWMLNNNTTPWYSSMRLYRQKYKGNWNSVFKSIALEIENILSERRIPAFLDTPETVYLGLSKGENFGGGICSKYLKKELSKLIKTINLHEHKELLEKEDLQGKIFHAITDINFCSLYMIKGKKNIGYTFFENEIPVSSIKKAFEYDLILAGSTWGKNKMQDSGILHSDILLQGIDHELFYPFEESNSNLFRIFSGGEFEYRKGQDLVLKAVKILQEKYSDIVLINAWYNLWPSSILTMYHSKHLYFELKGNTWTDFMANIYNINGMDTSRIITLPLIPNNKLRDLYLKTDIGVFPYRCEGGTNLTLMEYMACAKPVIATNTSGHKDILTDTNSMLLKDLKPCKIFDKHNTLISDWDEADLEELVDKIETAYLNRGLLKTFGVSAANDMKQYTWENCAKTLFKFLNS